VPVGIGLAVPAGTGAHRLRARAGAGRAPDPRSRRSPEGAVGHPGALVRIRRAAGADRSMIWAVGTTDPATHARPVRDQLRMCRDLLMARVFTASDRHLSRPRDNWRTTGSRSVTLSAELGGDNRGLRPAVDTQFRQQCLLRLLDGVLAQRCALGDLAVRQPIADQGQYRLLLIGQSRERA
jgi:hypothetical protein